MIRDRGSNYTTAFNAVLADAGIRTVLCNVRTPRMNAIAERWIGGCRRELLDRTLIWNQDHLRQILRQYETHHNQHRPHRSLDAAAPLKPLPQPVVLERIAYEGGFASAARFTNIAWSRNVDGIFGTHSSRITGQKAADRSPGGAVTGPRRRSRCRRPYVPEPAALSRSARPPPPGVLRRPRLVDSDSSRCASCPGTTSSPAIRERCHLSWRCGT